MKTDGELFATFAPPNKKSWCQLDIKLIFGVGRSGYLCTVRNGCRESDEKENYCHGDITVTKSEKNSAYFCRRKRNN